MATLQISTITEEDEEGGEEANTETYKSRRGVWFFATTSTVLLAVICSFVATVQAPGCICVSPNRRRSSSQTTYLVLLLRTVPQEMSVV